MTVWGEVGLGLLWFLALLLALLLVVLVSRALGLADGLVRFAFVLGVLSMIAVGVGSSLRRRVFLGVTLVVLALLLAFGVWSLASSGPWMNMR